MVKVWAKWSWTPHRTNWPFGGSQLIYFYPPNTFFSILGIQEIAFDSFWNFRCQTSMEDIFVEDLQMLKFALS